MRNSLAFLLIPVIVACGPAEPAPGGQIMPCSEARDCEAFGAEFAGYRCAGATDRAKGLCVPDNCGDGALDVGEECDDANDDSTDECTATCEEARCGDGIVQDGVEACDDGNEDDADSTCTNACTTPACGDGIQQVDLGEACDDGNVSDDDDCSSDCQLASCGDGVVQAGEECDDGNAVETDACINCLDARCGDGFVQEGSEECDDANEVDTDDCTSVCLNPVCGDGFHQPGNGEACDDGNQINADDCTNACRLATCGDGEVQAGEECDDGNDVDTDTCANCNEARCGDGIVRVGVEECDDGNVVDADNCTNACTSPVCGDGVIQPALDEACDDGNQVDTDACRANCQPAACGDGVIHQGVEACDDGNQVATDACTAACEVATCGDGVQREDLEPGDMGYEFCDGQGYCSPECRYRARQLSAGQETTCALRDGTVYCWGVGTQGELGAGDNPTRSLTPHLVPGLQNITELSAGYGLGTCAIEGHDGTLSCWGRNIPTGASLEARNTPFNLGTGFTGGSSNGGAIYALKNGAVYSAGSYVFHMLGNGGPVCTSNRNCGASQTCPAAIAGGTRYCRQNSEITSLASNRVRSGFSRIGSVSYLANVRMLSAGGNHACVITAQSRARCWGRNYHGQGGTGASGHDTDLPYAGTDVKTPPPPRGFPSALGNVTDLGLGIDHSCAVARGDVYCWGNGMYGALGRGSTQSSAYAVRVDDNGIGSDLVEVVSGAVHSCARTELGEVYCWGSDSQGQLGNDGVMDDDLVTRPVRVAGLPMRAVSIVAGAHHSCAMLSDGSVRCWGRNNQGQLGNNSTQGSGLPVDVNNPF